MKRAAWLLALVLVILFVYRLQVPGGRLQEKADRIEDTGDRREVEDGKGPAEVKERGGLNREAFSLIYSKHARCRMDCRHISEKEVLEILRNGRINYNKSDMRGQPDPKYALEGSTDDGQEVRIIFANSPRGIVVVTVIDLENEWKCNCK